MTPASPPAGRLRQLRVTELPGLLLVLLAGRDERRRLRTILRSRAARKPCLSKRRIELILDGRVSAQERDRIAGHVTPQGRAIGVRNLRLACDCTRCGDGRVQARDLCLPCYRASRVSFTRAKAAGLRGSG
jgi:hypothetical protein